LPPRRIRTSRRELGTAAALAAVLFLAGCGSGAERAAPPPRQIPHALAAKLASRSDDVARLLERQDECGALAAATELQRETIAAINSRRVPTRLQEPLLAAANDLTVRITCVPPQPAARDGEDGGKHGKAKGKGKGKAKGHGKGHGKDKGGGGGDED
jgi:hypothetical protein